MSYILYDECNTMFTFTEYGTLIVVLA